MAFMPCLRQKVLDRATAAHADSESDGSVPKCGNKDKKSIKVPEYKVCPPDPCTIKKIGDETEASPSSCKASGECQLCFPLPCIVKNMDKIKAAVKAHIQDIHCPHCEKVLTGL
jgi:hypothetical protein